MIYSEKLRKIRKLKRMTQKDVADHLGIHNSRYSQYENSEDIFPIKHLNKVCALFNISLDFILEFSNQVNYKNNTNIIDAEKSGNRIKNLRINLGITQKELAKNLKCSPSIISLYETGKVILSTPHLYELCKKYKISADYILGKINEPKKIKLIEK